MPFRYPVALELTGRRCVVVGGGEVGEHKARALLEAGASVVVVSDTFTERLEDLARRGEVELVRRPYREGDLQGAFLAVAATGEPPVNRAIFAEAERCRVLLNAVDDPSHCHFSVPAVVRRGELAISISTGGAAPALAKRLRKTIARQFGPEWAVLVELLGQVREEEIAGRDVDFATWASRWQEALGHDLPGLLRRGRVGEARRLVRSALRGEGPGGVSRGRVDIVGAGPGDPGLIPVRGRDLLDEADVVVHDRLVPAALLDELAAAGTELVDAGKRSGCHPVPQEEINHLLVRLALEGKRVVRLKGGDPFVFGRGAEEAEAIAEARVPFSVVPAPSSAVAVPAYAGIPLTDRRHASSAVIVTGHCATGGGIDWKGLARSAETIVVLMGLARLPEIAAELIRGGRDPATPSAVVENGTMEAQRVVTAPLGELAVAAAAAAVSPPATIVVGEVVRLAERISWFGERVPAGVHGRQA